MEDSTKYVTWSKSDQLDLKKGSSKKKARRFKWIFDMVTCELTTEKITAPQISCKWTNLFRTVSLQVSESFKGTVRRAARLDQIGDTNG